MKYSVAASTDIGSRKNINQDTYLAKTAKTNYGTLCMALICDGMGGLEEGEKASQLVAKSFAQWFSNELRNMDKADLGQEKLDKLVEDILLKTNNELMDYGNRKKIRVGTTASIIIFLNEYYHIYHVGDTRIYKYNKELTQITQDHTLVAAKVKKGELTKEEARISKERNILLQCVGVNDFLRVEKLQGSCAKGDIFMLCCDGLYNKLEEDEISDTLKSLQVAKADIMKLKIEQLIYIVKSRGETDNISGLLIRLE